MIINLILAKADNLPATNWGNTSAINSLIPNSAVNGVTVYVSAEGGCLSAI